MSSDKRPLIDPKRAVTVTVIYIVLMLLAFFVAERFIDRDWIQHAVTATAPFGALVFLLIAYFFVVVVPGFNTPIHVAAGYIFGASTGWLLNFIATTAGLFTILIIVRRFGRTALVRLVREKTLERYDTTLSKVGPLTLFVLYVLPGLPDDEVTYLLGAAPSVRFGRYIAPVVLGTAAKTSVSYVGDTGAVGLANAVMIRVVIGALGLLVIGLQEYFASERRRAS